jgi:hypothetical protein
MKEMIAVSTWSLIPFDEETESDESSGEKFSFVLLRGRFYVSWNRLRAGFCGCTETLAQKDDKFVADHLMTIADVLVTDNSLQIANALPSMALLRWLQNSPEFFERQSRPFLKIFAAYLCYVPNPHSKTGS